MWWGDMVRDIAWIYYERVDMMMGRRGEKNRIMVKDWKRRHLGQREASTDGTIRR